MFRFKLSILVITHNHEKYIQQALDSIVNQKKDFTYEVLVGEDASTDHTGDLIRNYDRNGLSNFHVYYRKKNIGALNNIVDLIRRAEGEYLIVLEGDDYWLSCEKLNRQVEFLDKNQEFIAVSHKCLLVDENSVPLPYSYSAECYRTEYTLEDFKKGILPGQTATIMYRNIYKDIRICTDLVQVNDYPGDRRFAFLLASNGKIRCWSDKLSAYRYVVLHGESHSATVKEDRNYLKAQLEFYRSIYDYSKQNACIREAYKISEQCYMKVLFRDQFRKEPIWPRKMFGTEIKNAKYKFADYMWILYSVLEYPIERMRYKRYLLVARKVEENRYLYCE